MRPVNACIVVHPYTARKNLGFGHDRYACELIGRLPKQGVEVSVFDSGDLKNIPEALLAELIAVWRLKMIRRDKVVYHGTAAANGQAPISAGKHPVITTILDVIWLAVGAAYDSRVKNLLKSAAIKRAALRSDAVIVPFTSQREYLVNELRVPGERVKVIHLGVDHQAFYPRAADEELPRPKFMPADGTNVLFVGATNIAKGIDTLIECFPRVREKVKDARLIVGSKGWDTPKVMEIWERSPVREHIHMVGFIPEAELRAAYVYADVTCFPSRYGFGLSTLESMACGTPTVSGRALDAPEFIGDAGLMSDPNSQEELAHEIIRACTDEALRGKLVTRGLETAKRYSWDRNAAETAELYRALL